MDNGKDVTILGDETFKLDEAASNQNANTVADVSDSQKALLDGKDLSNLEETAAGGNAVAGGGDGVSLGAATFDQGGHYSNISENFRPIGDLNSAIGAERIGGVSGGADNAGDGAAASDPELSRKPSNPGVKYPEDKDDDGKISFDENKPNNGGDNTPNKTTVEITIPNDGSVKPEDKLKVTDPEGNVVVDRPITQGDIDKGKVVVPNIPVKPGNNTTIAEITNPNNPNNKGIGTGDIT